MPRSILSLLLVSFLTSAIEAKGTKYALLIGVSKYDPKQLDNLRFPEKDVTKLADVLVDSAGFQKKNVRLLTVSRAFALKERRWMPIASSIRKELKLLARRAERDDTVIIAFAGHGVQFRGEKENYFCPADADLTKRKTLIGMKSEVYRLLDQQCDARVKLLFVDACRDDPRSKVGRGPKVNLQKLNNPQGLERPKGIAAFFSCKSGQEAFEHSDLGHGVFFHFVIEGLKGKARTKKGAVTLPSLKQYVKDSVIEFVDSKLNANQIPDLREDSTDVITLVEPGESALVKEITNSIGMKLRLIPAGTFMMGSPDSEKDRYKDEGPQHKVELTKPFYMGVYEVTQAEYEKVMGKNPSYFNREKVSRDTSLFPVEQVSWKDAVEFCKKLSEMASEKRAGRVYRLPTEAEWEYACRGGAKQYQAFAFGGSLTTKQANFKYELKRTCKVGSYLANAFGLHDMHGNVYEWCSDFYFDKAYAKGKRTDPGGPKTGRYRVLRGGCWNLRSRSCRSASRFRFDPSIRDYFCGFRVACRLD